MAKVTYVDGDVIRFDNQSELCSEHEQDCCENHYLDFSNLTVEDFDNLDFDLTSPDFFERVDGYGIRLIPVNGHPINIPGYGYNNGYYSSDLTLVMYNSGVVTKFDISECQEVHG